MTKEGPTVAQQLLQSYQNRKTRLWQEMLGPREHKTEDKKSKITKVKSENYFVLQRKMH